MTHDTPPKRIFIPKGAELGVLLVDTEGLIEEDAYILASEAEAMVAAALRGAANMVGSLFPLVPEAGRELADRIIRLIPQPASAALDKLIAEAVKAERERCAQIADDHTPGKYMGGTLAAHVTGRTIADAIRAAKGATP